MVLGGCRSFHVLVTTHFTCSCWLPKPLKIKINFSDLSTVIFLVANKFQKQKLNDLKLH